MRKFHVPYSSREQMNFVLISVNGLSENIDGFVDMKLIPPSEDQVCQYKFTYKRLLLIATFNVFKDFSLYIKGLSATCHDVNI